MIKNYFKIAFRNIWKNKVFSFINIFGLAVSIASFMLICGYLYKQLNYDTYAENSEQIYRVQLHLSENGGVTVFPAVDVAVSQGIKKAFPEVQASTRLSTAADYYVRYGDKQFKEKKLAIVDSNFLQVFSIPFIAGNAKTALVEPKSIVVTKDFAEKYFGDASALGKTLLFNNRGSLKVTGVIDEIPDNSHFHFDAFISSSTFPFASGETWSNIGWFTYLVLSENADVLQLESKFPQLVAEHVMPEVQLDMGVSLAQAQKSVNTFVFKLMPLTNIHLYSHTKHELEPNGDIQYVYIFGALAFFILLLACVNFTNLATASAGKRSREVGIRKVLGSHKKQLIFQFLAESVLMAFYALIIALVFIYLLLPWFNSISGEKIDFLFFLNPEVIILMIVFTFVTGILAGIYPSFFLSSFRTIKVLKGNGAGGKVKSYLRNALVVFQFGVSIVLIIATIIVYQQLHFMQHKKLGYDKEQVVIIHDSYLLQNNQIAFKQKLLRDSRIFNISIAWGIPASTNMDATQIYAVENRGNETRSEIHTNIYHIDYDYIPTMGMEIAAGRNFSRKFATDSSAVLINESAAKALGWKNEGAIGQRIVRSGNESFKVVGVVEDFQFASAKQKIAPLIMLLDNYRNSIIIKMNTTNVKNLIADIQKEWNSFNPDAPFSYTFLDETFNNIYIAEVRTSKIFTAFAIIAILIACLGLLGLVAYSAERRTKEIGVRKVLGSSVREIVFLLSKDFVKLILISTLIAVPIAWLAMHQWLQDFAYRITISWWVFLIAILSALIIALITISFQAIKAAIANPVKSLRSE